MLKYQRKYLTEVIAHCMFTHLCYAFLSVFLSLHYSGLIDWGCKECDDPASVATFEQYQVASVAASSSKPHLEAGSTAKSRMAFLPGIFTVLSVMVMDYFGGEAPATLSSAGLTRLSLLAEMFIYLLFILPFLLLAALLGMRYSRFNLIRLENAVYSRCEVQRLACVIPRRAGPCVCS